MPKRLRDLTVICKFVSVYAEAVCAVLEESDNLTGSGESCVEVGFGCLRSHFLGCEKHTVGEFLNQNIGISRFDISHVFDVGASLENFGQFGFIDYFLAGRIDEYGTLGHTLD